MGKEIIEAPQRGFTLTVPDGFGARPDLQSSPNVVYAFHRPDQPGGGVGCFLIIQDLGGLLERERQVRRELPSGFAGSLFKMRWHGLDLDVVEVPEKAGDLPFVTYNVQIPLRPSAIQVEVGGPARQSAEIKSLLKEVLAGLRGSMGWAPTPVPKAVVRSPFEIAVGLGIIVIIVAGGLVCLLILSRKAPRGAVLGLSVVIWLLGNQLGHYRVAVCLLLGGSMQFLGVVGGVLGLIDMIRKRVPRQTARSQAPAPIDDAKDSTPP